MADLTYNEFKNVLLAVMAGWDVRAMLVMSDTTVDTEDDVNTLDGFTDLDECDDTGYSRQQIGNEAVNEDAPNNRAEFDGDDITFVNNGDATRQVAGVLIYRHVTDDTDSVPIHFVDNAITLDGNTISIAWNAEGILQLS